IIATQRNAHDVFTVTPPWLHRCPKEHQMTNRARYSASRVRLLLPPAPFSGKYLSENVFVFRTTAPETAFSAQPLGLPKFSSPSRPAVQERTGNRRKLSRIVRARPALPHHAISAWCASFIMV